MIEKLQHEPRVAGNEEDAILASLRQRPVAEVMTRSLVTVTRETRVADATWTCEDERIHHLLVLDDQGGLAGVTCLYDLREADPDGTVETCMTTPVVCVEAGATLQTSLELMHLRGIGCLPIVGGGRLLGIVTRGDLRTAGLPAEEVAKLVCSACGSHHHVRTHPRMEGVAMCHLCLDRAQPPEPWEDVGVGD